MTSEVACYDLQHRGKKITLVDTPGFDDSSLSDRDILLKLLEWLKEGYDENRQLSGIIYLHRIDAPRMQGTALRNFGVFKQLCGEGFYKNVMLGTTCWDLVDADTVGKQREAQLKGKGGFWHALVLKGSEVRRIPRERELARDLVYNLALRCPAFLKSQNEMGSMGLRPDQVSATKAVNADLEELRAENERLRRQQQEEFERMQREREERARIERERERQRQEKLLREQELERQRILRLQRKREEQRAREMRELEEQMRQARIREAEEREKERKAVQKRLDDQQFKVDYTALCRAKASRAIQITVLSFLKVCGNCNRLLENETYIGKSCFNCGG